MTGATDLRDLNKYLSALAGPLGLAVYTRLVLTPPFGGSEHCSQVQVTLVNRRTSLRCSKSVAVRQFERGGVKIFDEFIAEAVWKLKQPPLAPLPYRSRD
jgi:hypothetical protein